MNLPLLKESIEGIDIYLLDQILKSRYQTNEKILDVGCGTGRNLKWFYLNNYKIYGIDLNSEYIEFCKNRYPKRKDYFKQALVNSIPYLDNSFKHIVCNAVLHFAKDLTEYLKMFYEMLRILEPGGSLFIRMASEFGIEHMIKHLGDGNYLLPDNSTRFLLTSELLTELKNNNNIIFLEDVKTTIVENKRSMTTIVLQKK
ncbi:class I SAM-dependent methyltransferase [uncultured Lutibacter sp.]|uniref:class I SAM-dependent methyltransferase n=1 Tax=uncultured Lutibacter sp. TaxID=437739 RepID=UPI0026071198|nr:class I SAM-dependent methyltransferase [uncultured Lutibacter sp.]